MTIRGGAGSKGTMNMEQIAYRGGHDQTDLNARGRTRSTLAGVTGASIELS